MTFASYIQYGDLYAFSSFLAMAAEHIEKLEADDERSYNSKTNTGIVCWFKNRQPPCIDAFFRQQQTDFRPTYMLGLMVVKI